MAGGNSLFPADVYNFQIQLVKGSSVAWRSAIGPGIEAGGGFILVKAGLSRRYGSVFFQLKVI